MMFQKWPLAMLLVLFASPSSAGELLQSVDFLDEGGCVQAHLRLKLPVRVMIPALAGSGAEISLPIEIISANAGAINGDILKATDGNIANLDGVALARTDQNLQVVLRFTKPVFYRVGATTETKHLRIDLRQSDATVCGGESQSSSVPTPATPAGATIEDARTAMSVRDYGKATAILRPLALSNDQVSKQAAEELLGVALESEGKFGEAISQYETFVARYPKTEAAARVRQRLIDLSQSLKAKPPTSVEVTALPSAAPSADTFEGLALKDNRTSLQNPASRALTLRSLRGIKDAAPTPGTWSWQTFGSISQSYYHLNTFDAGPLMKDGRLLSGISLSARAANDAWRAETRVDGRQQTDVGVTDVSDRTYISTAYIELENKQSHGTARIGRQSRNDGGIFGRFDGAWVGFSAAEHIDIGLAAGSPVYIRDQLPFEDGLYFFSARSTYNIPGTDLFADFYGIEQHAGSVVDRRALGSELRLEKRDAAVYAGADYDIYQGKLGSAYASTNWQAGPRMALHASFDYRTTPFLLTSNALTGQSIDQLPALMRLLGESQVVALAVDRTADAYSATLGGSYRWSDQWELALEGYWLSISGTPASGGVDAISGTGNDVYLSAYVYGNDILKQNDSFAVGTAYSEGRTTSRSMVEAYWRNPVTTSLSLAPRLRASLRESGRDTAYRFAPSLGARYRVTKHWLMESEIGVAVETGDAARDTELQGLIGYRYEF